MASPSLLGPDGRGYELAVRLERQGVWRTWLGSDALYRTFVPFLSSQASWDAFMTQQHHNTNNNKNVVDDDSSNSNKLILQLQLRARALLFDKASLSLYPRTLSSSNSILNPNYLELHVDDVYFTLESATQDGDQCITAGKPLSSKGPPIKSGALNSRQCGSEANALSQRFKSEEFPETWYSQFFEKSGASKSYRLMFGDRESEKRTPEQMSAYLSVAENHKRRRVAFHENVANVRSNDGSAVDDTPLFPETMYILNCVPDSAVPQTSRKSTNHRIPFNGVLDNLPQLSIKSPAINPIMIERLGIRPEYLNMERGLQTRGRNGYEGNRKLLGQEQASEMSQKIVARLLMNMGFDSSLDSSLEVLAQLLSCHISKLGRILKLVADSYRKQCSATELLKLFLRAAGQSNLGSLMEILKDNTKNVQQQNQQQMVGIQFQAQLQQLQQQNPIQQTPQMLRQMSPHMQQLNNPQYLAFQQQMHWERMRKRQQSTPRPGVAITEIVDRPRPPLVQVKMENPSSDFPMETNAFMGMNSRQAQAQVQLQQQQQQQQLVARSSLHAQQAIANSNALRPVGSPQIPQIQSPSMSMGRAPPVKVEGFQELMGSGDSSMKHDSEENKLTSPQK